MYIGCMFELRLKKRRELAPASQLEAIRRKPRVLFGVLHGS